MIIGVDIGGTKISVSLGREDKDSIEIVKKICEKTPPDLPEALDMITRNTAELIRLAEEKKEPAAAIGISCGGPLDSKKGTINSPPNLPGWDNVPIVRFMTKHFDLPCALQNDANACALAEHAWGAGKGTDNMIFLTFGTGLGAGLILNGDLYTGTNEMAGEVGHIRLEPAGPVGFRKAGSFEGFCSGGGIAQLGQKILSEYQEQGKASLLIADDASLRDITAKTIGEAAEQGDPAALKIWATTGEKLGQGLAILIDLLNPECIVIGSIFMRQEKYIRPAMEKALREEALETSLAVCRVAPAALGENLGDYAALSIASDLLMHSSRKSMRKNG